MTKDKENLYEMEIALCNLVSIAENAVGKEEFEKLDNAGAEIIECLAELERYKAIGTIEDFKALKEKSVAKKPMMYGIREYRATCPHCNEWLEAHSSKVFCCYCGQKIDFGKEE